MDAEPHSIGYRAFEFVAPLPDLGDGGILADHRHDTFVVIVESGTRLARDIGQDILGCPPPRLLCYRTELRKEIAVAPRNVGEVA